MKQNSLSKIRHGPPSVTLVHGDCIPGMRRLENESIDLVVTSPPYNLGTKYRTYRDNKERADYRAWCFEWAKEIRRILKRDGSFFLNIGGAPSDPMLPFNIATKFAPRVFALQNVIHWIKAISISAEEGNIVSKGHFKPISSWRFLNDCHEFVFHFTKAGRTPIDRLALGVPYTDKTNISRWGHTNGRDLRCRGNTWFIPYKTIRDREKERPHPASFPPELVENCIRLHGRDRVGTMLDPFVGIGSAAVAAQRCGVPKFLGFDIDGHYLNIAAEKTRALVIDHKTLISAALSVQPTETIPASY